MRILVVEPIRKPEVKEIDGSLESMQGVVGGLIQPVYPFEDRVALICNEEGKLMGLPPNRGLRNEDGQLYDILFGTFFLCGLSKNCCDFTSLTQEQIEQYQERFLLPEMFYATGNG